MSAELGADSIHKGAIAAIVSVLGVVVFMLVTYGRFGVYANIALVVNAFLILGIMAMFNATLTLAGHCRLHPHHRRRGRRQRADQRANTRGNPAGTKTDRRGRDRLSRSVPRHFRRQRHARDLGRRSWPISAQDRCAASPSCCSSASSPRCSPPFISPACWWRCGSAAPARANCTFEAGAMKLLKLVPDHTNLDFMRWRNLALILSHRRDRRFDRLHRLPRAQSRHRLRRR